MARRKLTSPTKAVTYRISEHVASKFELLLLDPVANRTAYGKKSLIVESLINKTIEAIKLGKTEIDITDLISLFGGQGVENRTTKPVGL